MTAAYWKISIGQGSTWRTLLTLTEAAPGGAVDLTGYTARMQIREALDSPQPLYELSTSNGGIAIDGPAGQLTLLIPGADSTPWNWRYGVYDLLLTDPGGEPDRLLQGEVEVDQAVTR